MSNVELKCDFGSLVLPIVFLVTTFISSCCFSATCNKLESLSLLSPFVAGSLHRQCKKQLYWCAVVHADYSVYERVRKHWHGLLSSTDGGNTPIS